MAHPVVWFEVNGKQSDELIGFYQKLFGWKIDANNPMHYGMVQTGAESGIPGGIGERRDDKSPGVTFYVQSSDLASSLARAEKLGGKTILPPTQAEGGPELAMLADPQGNLIGLVKG